MATATQLRVNIAFRAADRIIELGLWDEFKAMVDHIEQTVPGLSAISVALDKDARGGEASIILWAELDAAHCSVPSVSGESPQWRWSRWAAHTFVPDALRHFCMMTRPAREPAVNGR